MALKVDYETRNKVKLPDAYVTIRDPIWRSTNVTVEGVTTNMHFLQAVACVWQSEEHAATRSNPLEEIELVFAADPAQPSHEQAYAALRDLKVPVYLTQAQAAELEAMPPDVREARRRELLGDRADGYHPFADAVDA